eukprot:SAG31_NODE_7874_length_1576_cov_1.626947_2_plen_123_part_00
MLDPPSRSILLVQVRSAWVASTEAVQLCSVVGALSGLAAEVTASAEHHQRGHTWIGLALALTSSWALGLAVLWAGRAIEDCALGFDAEQQIDRRATPGTLQLAALHSAGWYLVVAAVLVAAR